MKIEDRIRLVKRAILEARKKLPLESPENCWGAVGVLEYLETGNIHKIRFRSVRTKLKFLIEEVRRNEKT